MDDQDICVVRKKISKLITKMMKGMCVGVGLITLVSSSEVCMVKGLKHNFDSVTQLCDAGFEVSFNTTTCMI